jgi:hypothetical protein
MNRGNKPNLRDLELEQPPQNQTKPNERHGRICTDHPPIPNMLHAMKVQSSNLLQAEEKSEE